MVLESVDFHASTFVKNDEYPDGLFNFVGTRAKIDCHYCEGTGTSADYTMNPVSIGGDDSCEMCDGTGKSMGWVDNGPELNVSNGNAAAICQALGLPLDSDDCSGAVSPEKIPELRRKLIALKNAKNNPLIEPDSKSQSFTRGIDRSGDVPQITTRRGPEMYHMGRTSDQVMRYVDKLLEICEFAQKNGYWLTWA